jgi:hypothetical protein
MTELPEELSKLSSRELVNILDVEKYKAKYFIIGKGNYNHCQIFKLIKRFKNISIYEDLETHSTISFDYKHSIAPIPLSSGYVAEFKYIRSKNLLNAIPNLEFDVYLKKVASSIFGEDKVDTEYNYYYNCLTIYFPELIITNSVETLHTMYDIYIQFTFANRTDGAVFGRGLDNIKFARTTFTDVEVASIYQFSHVSSSDPGTYSSSFCFGSTPLATAILRLREGKLDMLSTVLMNLENYLTWESIEGSPYRPLSNMIKGERYVKVDIDLHYSEKAKFYNIILNKMEYFNYTYNLINGAYKIGLSKECIDSIEKILTRECRDLVYPLVDGVSCIENTNLNLDKFKRMEGIVTSVTFKGETKNLKIIHTIKEEERQVSKSIHRTALNYIVEALERDFYNYLINKKLTEAA